MKKYIKLVVAFAAVVFAASCQKPYDDLVPSFAGGDVIAVNPGETATANFTLNDVRKGDVITGEVKSDNSEYTASISFDPDYTKGYVEVSAPSKVLYGDSFNLTVTFNDKENARFATKTLTVQPKASELESLAPQFSAASVELESGKKATVDFTLNDVRNNTVEAEVQFKAAEAYAAEVKFNSDYTKGSLEISAPQLILDDTPFDVTVNFKDASGRNASSVVKVNPKLVAGLAKFSDHANTFVVAPGSIVVFPTYKGKNGSKAGAETLSLAWQDNAGLFTEVLKIEDGQAIVRFAEGKEGNAYVNGLDAAGNVVWSWLFWVVSDSPKDVTVGGYTFMDRNIGALNLDEKSELSVGVAYQYGRKDPFPGIQFTKAAMRAIFDASGAEIQIPLAFNEAEDNLETTIKTPTVYYCNKYFSGQKHNYSWVTTDCTVYGAQKLKALWYNDGNKSDYDPCPAGYKVSPKAAWDGVKAEATTPEEIWDSSYETYDSSAIGTNEKYAAGNRKKVQFRGCIYNGLRLTITGEINSNSTAFSFANYVGKPQPTAEVWCSDPDPDFETKVSASYFRGMCVKVNTSGNGNYDDVSGIKVNALSTTGKYGLNYAIPVRCVKE